MFALAVAIALACVAVFDRAQIVVPGADGPRYVRQFALAWLPVLGAVTLIDPTPEVSATLPRTSRVYLLLRCATLVGTLLPLVVAWLALGDVATIVYEALAAGVLLAVAIGAVSRWQSVGLLVASLGSVVWLLMGDSLAAVMGFAETNGAPVRIGAQHWVLAGAGLLACVWWAFRGAGSTRLLWTQRRRPHTSRDG